MSKTQNFIFSTDIWNIIISKLDGSSFRNLSLTCKYFYEKQEEIKANRLNLEFLFSKYNIITVDHLEIVSSGGSKNIVPKNFGYIKSLKLCIDKDFSAQRLIVRRIFSSTSRQPFLSSSIFSKIMFFDNLTELAMEYNKLTWREYLLLTASGRITRLSLEGVDIIDGRNNLVSVDMIMSKIPYASKIHIQPCHFTPETNSNLLSMKRPQKVSSLNFVNITGNFDSNLFYNFLKNTLYSSAEILIHFAINEENNHLNEIHIEQLKKFMIREEWIKALHMDYPRILPPLLWKH